MFERLFPICSLPTPRCIGREKYLRRLEVLMEKKSAPHCQVVGPRFSGKTVLLTEFVERTHRGTSSYCGVFLWDLAHSNFGSDVEFIKKFGLEIGNALQKSYPTYAEILKDQDALTASEISEVLDSLASEQTRLLAVLDGFDNAVRNGLLTRNLWDQLRNFASKPSLRLITSSRRRLSQLIRDSDTESSPFWNIFDPSPVEVTCFDEIDLETILDIAQIGQVTKGAYKEWLNATNGFPILALEVINQVAQVKRNGDVTEEALKTACDTAFGALRDRLKLLWSDCSSTSKDLFHQIREEKNVLRNDVSNSDLDILAKLGFVQIIGNKISHTSRLLEQFLAYEPNESSSFIRLFASPESARINLKEVLKHRLNQISGLNSSLQRSLEHCLGDLPDHPTVFLEHIRNFCNSVLEIVWRVEGLSDRRIPSEWFDIWKRNQESPKLLSELETSFPKGGKRLAFLNLMTGTDKSIPVSKYINKETYVLIAAVHVFGDFGQHQENVVISEFTAYSMLHTCIELACVVTNQSEIN